MNRLSLLLLLWLQGSAVADVVCHGDQIIGYDAQYYQAKQVLPLTTSDPEACVVFVTKAPDGSLYAHSNFKSPNADYPTKVALKTQSIDLETLFRNIIGRELAFTEPERLHAIHNTKARYILDSSLIRPDGSLGIEDRDAGHIDIWFRGEQEPTHTVRLENDRGPPGFAVEAADRLFVKLSGASPRGAFSALRDRSLSPADFVLWKFVDNSATDKALKEARLEPHLAAPVDYASASIEQLFNSNQRKTIAVLGHFEAGAFVMNDSKGNEVARVQLTDLENLAARYNCTLLPLGCKVGNEGAGGPLERFNTVELAKKLGVAVQQPNLLGFFQALAGEDLRFVVPEIRETGGPVSVELSIAAAPTEQQRGVTWTMEPFATWRITLASPPPSASASVATSSRSEASGTNSSGPAAPSTNEVRGVYLMETSLGGVGTTAHWLAWSLAAGVCLVGTVWFTARTKRRS
jgi:hypothetical protein